MFRVIQPIHRTAKEPALGYGFPKHALHPTEGQALCRPCTAVPSYHWSPSSVPQAIKDEARQENLHFPTELTLLSARYRAVLLSCSPHLGSPSATTICFSCPRRTPAFNLISKRFEGSSCACKQAGVMPSRSHALVVSSDVANKMGNNNFHHRSRFFYILVTYDR